jgi:hypothetical protein
MTNALTKYLKFVMPVLAALSVIHVFFKPFDIWNWVTILFVVSYYLEHIGSKK